MSSTGIWACDIAVEYVIDGLQLRAVHVPKTMLRREYYRKLKEAGETVTAQRCTGSFVWSIRRDAL